MITVTELNIYPVKSLRGSSVRSAEVTTRGLRFDREWMIVDQHNRFITQRDLPAMATIDVKLKNQQLEFSHPSMPELALDLRSCGAKRRMVKVWKDHTQAIDQGDDISTWLTEVLGEYRGGPLRLVRFDPTTPRNVEPTYLGSDRADVQFADGYPFLVCAEETLTQLNQALVHPVPMNRFRGNIIIAGLRASQEHCTAKLKARGNDLLFALVKPCQRCKITTTDQRTGEVSAQQEPLRTLVAQNPLSHLTGGFFGQNAILLSGEGTTLSVGDTLQTTVPALASTT